MTNRNLEALSDRERACLAHLEEAKRLGVSFTVHSAPQQGATVTAELPWPPTVEQRA